MAETVSVIIAVYNGEQYLRECIESVLGQTMPPGEVIVVDGHFDRYRKLDDLKAGFRAEAVSLAEPGTSGTVAGLATSPITCTAAVGIGVGSRNSRPLFPDARIE